MSVLIDRGRDWPELAGVRVEGVAEAYPAEHPDLRAPMSQWHEKYRQMFARDGFEAFTRDVHALGFLRVVPSRSIRGTTAEPDPLPAFDGAGVAWRRARSDALR